VEKRAEIVALNRPIDWQIARKRGQIKTMAEGAEKETLKATQKAKATVRAFVEHPFHTGRCAIEGWPKTGINSTRSSDWPTS
jgi:hypothetical protein